MTTWRKLDGEEAVALERELRRELPEGHALYGRTVRAFARGEHPDDVAFHLEGAGLCVVHLTWRTESDPGWPHVAFVESLPEGDDD